MIRLPNELLTDGNGDGTPKNNDDARTQRAIEVKENVNLEKLARALIEQKIRPEILREDVVSDLCNWLRDMLTGPALPLNKEKNFIEDVLKSTDFVADAEIFVETLPGCYTGLIERNRADGTKKSIYPDVDSSLRVREDVLRNRCVAMVNHFAKKKNITDEGLKKKASDDFYIFYHDAITEGRPASYNSYTGVMACMGNLKFLKQSEDIVMYGLGLTKELPEELVVLKSAPPAFHTVAVFVIAMSLCIWALPSMQSIDEHSSIETFTTSIFKEGLFKLSPMTLGIVRIVFAMFCMRTTVAKILNGAEIKVVKLPGSKLRGGMVQMKGWRTQGFYTSWAWNILGLSFFLAGLIPILVVNGREDILHDNPWIQRAALVSFEIAAPSAFLTSSVVTYALWPKAYKDHGSSGTKGFRGWISLSQHNINSAMVLLETFLLGGSPVLLSHAAFAPLFGGAYQLFLWCMANHWSPKHGPVFPYFFMDTTLGKRTTIFLMVLLAVIGLFFVLFAILDIGTVMIEESDHGAAPNVCCAVFVAWMLMKFKD